jgi:predicted PurR-regulated permease PerM
MILSLIGMPVVHAINRLKIGKFHIHHTISAILTLCLFLGLIYIFSITFLPPLVEQISFLSHANLEEVLHNTLASNPHLKGLFSKIGNEHQIAISVGEQVTNFVNFKNVTSLFNNTMSYASTILGGLFSVLFITFFFLKDEQIVSKSILLITPVGFDKEMGDILRTSKKMLSKYFIGLFIDVLYVSIVVTTLMLVFGIRNALVIGCLAGIMNVIPYIGPIITLFFAVFLGVSGCIEYAEYDTIASTITKIILILIGTNLSDAMLVQPAIFSNTVKAHPLEIFLVILMAGAIGGIFGMVLAIPSYTLLRIIAKEFLDHFKFFKKLTENIPE